MDNYKDSRVEINLEKGEFKVKGTNVDFLVKCIGIGAVVSMIFLSATPLIYSIANLITHIK